MEEPGEGTRLGVKDLFDTAGLVTTYGSAIFRGHVPERTAAAVAALEQAGYVVVGKTNLHEFAYGVTSENPHYGPVVNPLDPARVAGGSSGGSAAAVAAGLCEVALGTDSGGSIRIPAACCGVVGFKPTHGVVPLEGCFPLAPSFDHVGPIAPSVPRCSMVMDHFLDARPRAPFESFEEVSVGVAGLDESEPEVREQVAAAAERFPLRRPVVLPDAHASYPIFRREVAEVHGELFAEHAELYGEDVRLKVEQCLAVTDAEYEAAAAARERFREELEEALDGLDLLLTPALPCLPPPRNRDAVGDLDVREDLIRFTYPFNAAGWPALALPCRPAEGFPASVQLVGRPGADRLVLAAGELLESLLARPGGP